MMYKTKANRIRRKLDDIHDSAAEAAEIADEIFGYDNHVSHYIRAVMLSSDDCKGTLNTAIEEKESGKEVTDPRRNMSPNW